MSDRGIERRGLAFFAWVLLGMGAKVNVNSTEELGFLMRPSFFGMTPEYLQKKKESTRIYRRKKEI
jgi:hypothetical protein